MKKELIIENLCRILGLKIEQGEYSFWLLLEKLKNRLKSGEALQIENLGTFQYKNDPVPREEWGDKGKSVSQIIFKPDSESGDEMFQILPLEDQTRDLLDFNENVFSPSIDQATIPFGRGIVDSQNAESSVTNLIEDLINHGKLIQDFDVVSGSGIIQEAGDTELLAGTTVNGEGDGAIENTSSEDIISDSAFSELLNDEESNSKPIAEDDVLEEELNKWEDEPEKGVEQIENISEESQDSENTVVEKNEVEEIKEEKTEKEIEEKVDTDAEQLDSDVSDEEIPLDDESAWNWDNKVPEEDEMSGEKVLEDVVEEDDLSTLEKEIEDFEKTNNINLEDDDIQKKLQTVINEEVSEEDPFKVLEETIDDDDNISPDEIDEFVEKAQTKIEEPEDILPTDQSVEKPIVEGPKKVVEQAESEPDNNGSNPGFFAKFKYFILFLIVIIVAYFAFFNESGNSLQDAPFPNDSVSVAQKDSTPLIVAKVDSPTEITDEKNKTEELDNGSTTKSKPQSIVNNTTREMYQKFSTDKGVGGNIFYNGNEYMIQVSSWRNSLLAEKEVGKLKRKGYDAFIVKAFVKKFNATFNRVRIGGFASKAEASAFENSNLK